MGLLYSWYFLHSFSSVDLWTFDATLSHLQMAPRAHLWAVPGSLWYQVHISWTSPRMKGVLDYCPAWVERWRGTECVQPLSHIVIYWCSLSDLFSSNTTVVRETADVSWFGLISILFWSWYLYNWGHVVLWRVCVTTSKGEAINRMRFHSELIPAKLKFFTTPSWDCCF